jgi:hypothetical protein
VIDPSTSSTRVRRAGHSGQLRLRAAECATCGAPIYLEVFDPDHASRWSLRQQRQAAIQDHLASHPAVVLARWRERARHAPEPRACFTLADAVGSAAVYALWLSTRRGSVSDRK